MKVNNYTGITIRNSILREQLVPGLEREGG